MLVIRMQRTGRKGHAQFRVVVQDSRRTPTSGKIVASLGHFDPHSKTTSLNKEKASFYLENGAQPSERVVRLLKSEGVKLPTWVKVEAKKEGKLRHPEKLRKNRPAAEETTAEDVTEAPAEETAAPEEVSEAPVEDSASEAEATDEKPSAQSEETVEETPAPEAAETPAEDSTSEE